MGCNAWNHSPDCDCGWGGVYYGEDANAGLTNHEIEFLPFALRGYESDLDAYLYPNALCPVCGDEVYFVQMRNGGRVFFDELGPPWPKHPCTDNPQLAVPQISSDITEHRENTPTPPWAEAGFEPFIFARKMDGEIEIGSDRDWAKIWLRDDLTGDVRSLLFQKDAIGKRIRKIQFAFVKLLSPRIKTYELSFWAEGEQFSKIAVANWVDTSCDLHTKKSRYAMIARVNSAKTFAATGKVNRAFDFISEVIDQNDFCFPEAAILFEELKRKVLARNNTQSTGR